MARWPGMPGMPHYVRRGGAVRPTTLRSWAAGEMRRHDLVKVMEAGQAIGSYNARRWIGEVDVPTTVLITTKDRAIPAVEQHKLAEAIPGSEVHLVDDGHVVCARPSFGTVLTRAVDSVAVRRPAPVARLAR